MIALYKHGISVWAAKVQHALANKDFERRGHYFDILLGDRFDLANYDLSLKGVVAFHRPTVLAKGNYNADCFISGGAFTDCLFADSFLCRPAEGGDHAGRLMAREVLGAAGAAGSGA